MSMLMAFLTLLLANGTTYEKTSQKVACSGRFEKCGFSCCLLCFEDYGWVSGLVQGYVIPGGHGLMD